jgi:hypothetical protein
VTQVHGVLGKSTVAGGSDCSFNQNWVLWCCPLMTHCFGLGIVDIVKNSDIYEEERASKTTDKVYIFTASLIPAHQFIYQERPKAKEQIGSSERCKPRSLTCVHRRAIEDSKLPSLRIFECSFGWNDKMEKHVNLIRKGPGMQVARLRSTLRFWKSQTSTASI